MAQEQRDSSDSARSDSLLFPDSETELVEEKLKTWTTKGGWQFQQNKTVFSAQAALYLRERGEVMHLRNQEYFLLKE